MHKNKNMRRDKNSSTMPSFEEGDVRVNSLSRTTTSSDQTKLVN